MSPRAKFCYIGVSSKGELQLVVSEETLHPVGHRLTQGDDFPKDVYDFYCKPTTHDSAVAAIIAMEGFLNGDIKTNSAVEFGQKAPRVRKPRQ